jgi:predicted ester cyclase
MSEAENMAIGRRHFRESHGHPYNLDVMDETRIPAYAEEHKRWQRMEHEAIADRHFAVEDVVAEGDKVVLRWTVCATHLGEFWTPVGTAAPTGQPFALTSTVIYRVADGRIAEEWPCHDWLRVVQQFGGARIRSRDSPSSSPRSQSSFARLLCSSAAISRACP